MTHGKDELSTAESAVPFFGKITASFTHDLNNIISIIDQSAGLMEDLLPGVGGSAGVPAAKFAAIAAKIRKHAGRGIVLIKHLNKFSHGVDYPAATININDVIANLMALTDRLFSNKGVVIEVNFMEGDCNLTNNAFVIQQILFMILENILAIAQKGDIIKISVHEESGGICITLNAYLAENISQFDFAPVLKLAASINSIVKVETEAKTLSASLLISELKSEHHKQ